MAKFVGVGELTRCFVLITAMACVAAINKNLPNGILHRLNNVKNLETFFRMFNIRGVPDIRTDRRIRNFDNVVALENEPCKLRPIVVEVPQPADPNSFHYPFQVKLYRCLGSCEKNPFASVCVPIVKEQVHLRVPSISWMSNHVENGAKMVYIPLFNHTDCGCSCKHDHAVCNRFQTWDEHRCKCICRACPSVYFTEHPKDCCVCNTAMKCPHRQKWSREKCKCICKKKRRCKNPNKVRDPKTCKCRCDLRNVCRYGSMNPQTCSCRSRFYG